MPLLIIGPRAREESTNGSSSRRVPEQVWLELAQLDGHAAATLLLDSGSEPLLAGVRTGFPSARLLLYAKGGRLLKLRVETLADAESLSLVGQVVEESAPHTKLSNLPVLIQSGRKTVSKTLTNQAGEFALDVAPAQQLRLVLGLPGADAMMVMLPVTAAVDDES